MRQKQERPSSIMDEGRSSLRLNFCPLPFFFCLASEAAAEEVGGFDEEGSAVAAEAGRVLPEKRLTKLWFTSSL
jgi:hypothetical protein